MSGSAAKQMAALQAMRANIMSSLDVAPEWEKDIKEAKSNNSSFTEIDWDYKGVDTAAIESLASALEKNTHIKSISVSGNNLPDSDVIILCNAIKKNKDLPLASLNLSFNQITKDSSVAIQSLLMRSGLEVHLFGTEIEKEMEGFDIGLRQTTNAKAVRKTSKTKKTSKKYNSTTRRVKSLTPADDVKQILADESNNASYEELTERLKELQEEEQDYILKIEELEQRSISLMKDKTGEAIKSSSLFKFKRSMTLETRNVIITRKLAEVGGSGAGVYSCLVDGWKCAMKELDTTHMAQYSIDGFMSEIQLLELLPQHENISRYLFHEISGNRIRLFMTQYHGSLGSYIQSRAETKQTFSPKEIWKLSLDIIKGIEFLHSNGIIHRDLKSDNIFILLNERREIMKCAIGDFDTAKQVNSKADQAKTVLGTPAWMAPEVMDAKELGSYSYSCDVYSFGMILYELLCLKMPYSGMNPMRIPMMVLQGQLPDPPEVDTTYSDIVKLYLKCVSFKPSKRPSVKNVKNTIATSMVK